MAKPTITTRVMVEFDGLTATIYWPNVTVSVNKPEKLWSALAKGPEVQATRIFRNPAWKVETVEEYLAHHEVTKCQPGQSGIPDSDGKPKPGRKVKAPMIPVELLDLDL